MDNKLGNFEEINEQMFNEQMNENPYECRVFKVGETLKIRGCNLVVKEITECGLILELVESISQPNTVIDEVVEPDSSTQYDDLVHRVNKYNEDMCKSSE